jgi:NADP-dependent 3-hydroxy acid dehydrogenase YdfG
MGAAVARRLAATGAAIACLGRRTDAGKAVAAGIRVGTRTVGQQLIVSLRQDR